MEKIDTKWLIRVSVLAAIVIAMSFTPIGYLKVGPVEITFLVIPVAVGAVVIGSKAGAALGAVFGITSFLQGFGMSQFGVTLLSINVFYFFVTCFVPRLLMGWLTGVLFEAIYKRDKSPQKLVSFSAASLAAPLLNTVLFMTFLIVLFGSSEYIKGMQGGMSIFSFVVAFVGINGLVEAIVSFIVGGVIMKSIFKIFNRNR